MCAAWIAVAMLGSPEMVHGGVWTQRGPDGFASPPSLRADPAGTLVFARSQAGASSGTLFSRSGGVSIFQSWFAAREAWDVAFDTAGNAYSTASDGVYRMPAGGPDWTRIVQGFAPMGSAYGSLAAGEDGTIYLATPSGVFRATAGATSWSPVTTTGLPGGFLGFPPTVRITSGGHLYLAISFGGGVFVLAPGGAQWSSTSGLGGFLNDLTVRADKLYAATSSGVFSIAEGEIAWSALTASGLVDMYVSAITTDSAGGVYAATNAAIYHLATGASTWTSLGNGAQTGASSLAVTSDGAIYAAAYPCGVWARDSSFQFWSLAVSGARAAPVSGLAIYPNGTVFAAAGTCGLFKKQPAESFWTAITTDGLPALTIFGITDVAIDGSGSVGAGTLYANVQGQVFRLPSGASKWLATSTLSGPSRLAVDEAGTVYAGTTNGVARLLAGESAWTGMTTAGLLTSPQVTALVVGRDGKLFAATSDGVFSFAPGDSTWKPTAGLPSAAGALAIDPDGIVYASPINGPTSIYKLAPGGTTWTSVPLTGLDLAGSRIEAIATDSLGALLVGGNGSAFKLKPGATTWARIYVGIAGFPPAESFWSMAVDPSDILYAGTHARGVLQLEPACADASQDPGEECDPSVIPSGCIGAGNVCTNCICFGPTTTTSSTVSTRPSIPISTTTSSSSTTTRPTISGEPCGNGVPDPGEPCDPLAPGTDARCCVNCAVIRIGQPCEDPEVFGACHDGSTCDSSARCVPKPKQEGVICRDPGFEGACDRGDLCDGVTLECPVSGRDANCSIEVPTSNEAKKVHHVNCEALLAEGVTSRDTECTGEGVSADGSSPALAGVLASGEQVVDPIHKRLRKIKGAKVRRTLKLKLNARGRALLKSSVSGTLVVTATVGVKAGNRQQDRRELIQLLTYKR